MLLLYHFLLLNSTKSATTADFVFSLKRRSVGVFSGRGAPPTGCAARSASRRRAKRRNPFGYANEKTARVASGNMRLSPSKNMVFDGLTTRFYGWLDYLFANTVRTAQAKTASVTHSSACGSAAAMEAGTSADGASASSSAAMRSTAGRLFAVLAMI